MTSPGTSVEYTTLRRHSAARQDRAWRRRRIRTEGRREGGTDGVRCNSRNTTGNPIDTQSSADRTGQRILIRRRDIPDLSIHDHTTARPHDHTTTRSHDDTTPSIHVAQTRQDWAYTTCPCPCPCPCPCQCQCPCPSSGGTLTQSAPSSDPSSLQHPYSRTP